MKIYIAAPQENYADDGCHSQPDRPNHRVSKCKTIDLGTQTMKSDEHHQCEHCEAGPRQEPFAFRQSGRNSTGNPDKPTCS